MTFYRNIDGEASFITGVNIQIHGNWDSEKRRFGVVSSSGDLIQAYDDANQAVGKPDFPDYGVGVIQVLGVTFTIRLITSGTNYPVIIVHLASAF